MHHAVLTRGICVSIAIAIAACCTLPGTFYDHELKGRDAVQRYFLDHQSFVHVSAETISSKSFGKSFHAYLLILFMPAVC